MPPKPKSINVDSILNTGNLYADLKKLDFGYDSTILKVLIAHKNTPDSIRFYCQYLFGKRQYYQSNWHQGAKLLRDVSDSYAHHFGEQYPMVLESYNWLGLAYAKLNKCDAMEVIVQKSQKLAALYPANYSALTLSTMYKNVGLYNKCIGEYENMITAYHQSHEVLKKARPKYIGEAAWALVNLAAGYLTCLDYGEAIKYNNLALPDLIKIYGEKKGEGFTSTVYNNLGSSYNGLGEFDKAIFNLRKAINKNLEFTSLENCHDGVAANFKNIAFSNESIGDLERAKIQFDIALQILEYRNHLCTERAGEVRLGLVRVLYQLNDLKEAQNLALKALEIEEQEGRIDGLKTTALLHMWLGKIYLEKGNFEKATHSFDKATTIYEHKLPATKNLLFEHLLEVGNSYVHAQLYDKGLKILLELYEETKNEFAKKEQLGLLIAKCYLNKNEDEKAREWLDFTTNASTYNLQIPNRFEKSYNINFLLPYFETHSKWFHELYTLHQDPIHLDSAILYLEEAAEYVFQKRSNLLYTSFIHQAFVSIQEQLCKLYEKRAASNWKEDVFKQFEISKAVKLLGLLKARQAFNFLNVPSSISNQLNELESQIKLYETQIQIIPEDGDGRKYAIKLDSTATELSLLKKHIQQKFPDYYNYRFKHQTIKPGHLQKQLKDNQILIEYFWGKDYVKAAFLTQKEIQIKTLGKATKLEKRISSFLQGINESHKGIKSSNTYMNAYVNDALFLHDFLIAPFSSSIHSNQTELIIIPDGAINSIPFNALLQSKPKDLRKQYQFDYLIHRYTISMGYSGTFQFSESLKYQRKSTKPYIGFAPYNGEISSVSEDRSTDERTGYTALPFSKLEVEKGHSILGGELYLNPEASMEKFLLEAASAQVLHCATHAVGNPKNGGLSHLLFPSEKNLETSNPIYANDIYELKLNADLVVLGTCQSARGEYIPGEGMISLAHAFSAAGANSICSTFWNLNDQSSFYILSTFFEEIKNGVPKNEALRNAQIKYLEEHQTKAHPYYWAVYNLFGDTGKVYFDRSKMSF